MPRKTAILFGFEALFLAVVIFLLTPLSGSVLSAVNNVVISEVQISGESSDDEFIELYNPTNDSVDVTGWRLARRTANAVTDTNNLVASMSGVIPAHSYFLVAHPDYTGSVIPDLEYSATSSALAANNAILLYRDEDGIESLEDKVGLGTSTNAESLPIANPQISGSIERKAKSTSTIESMTNGEDVLFGNGQDSDNNFDDFVLREVSDPQNTSIAETLVSQTASPSPTASVSPSPDPTSTPTVVPSPTPTPEESPAPTASASPSLTPSPTITPSPQPSATPKIIGTFRFSRSTCRLVDNFVNFGFIKFRAPKIECSWF